MNNMLAGFKNVGQQVKMHPRSKAHNDILVCHGFSAPIFRNRSSGSYAPTIEWCKEEK